MTGELVSFSEQYVLDCEKYHNWQGFHNRGTCQADPPSIFDYAIKKDNGFLMKLDAYPKYEAKVLECRSNEKGTVEIFQSR